MTTKPTKPIANRQDIEWMRRALALARRGMGRTAENPSVACLIVQSGAQSSVQSDVQLGTQTSVLVGQGVTARGGRPHAEVQALAMAGARAVGATAYVTLEPCAHHGETGPCAQALVEAGVRRCVTALSDPDPRVNGAGLAHMAKAGVEVESGVLAEQAAWDLAGFLRRKTRNMPHVLLKLATTLDGKIALGHGESKWITGPLARRWGHLLRAQSDAIVTGARTVKADDPALTARVPGLSCDDPMPYILTSAEGLSGDFQVLARGELLTALGDKRLPDPRWVLQTLAGKGHSRVMIEGGSGVAALFLNAGLVDEIALFQAPAFIGRDGLNAVGSLFIHQLGDLTRWRVLDQVQMGDERFTRLRHPNWQHEVADYV